MVGGIGKGEGKRRRGGDRRRRGHGRR